MERVKVAAGSTTPERRHLMRGKHREQQHSFRVQLVKLVAKQQVWGRFGLRGHAESQGFPWMAPIWNRLHEVRCSPSVLGRPGSPTQHGGRAGWNDDTPELVDVITRHLKDKSSPVKPVTHSVRPSVGQRMN